MKRTRICIQLFGILVIGIILSGCGLSYKIKDPALSHVKYGTGDMAPVALDIIDKRTGDDTLYLMGRIGMASELSDLSNILEFENIKDPVAFFATNLEEELNSRGTPVKCAVVQTSTADMILEINRYKIDNYRATGFSPWEACHVFDGTLIVRQEKKPIKAYFYNGKTPVWSMDEIVDPCFNIPAAVIIKEVASKINKASFNLKISDDEIQQLTGQIDANRSKLDIEGPFEQVLELGYGNNANAVEPLKTYAQQEDPFLKACALSAIGILGAEGQLEFLKQQYSNEEAYNSRYMALKAIGDIGSPEAMQFIQAIKKEGSYDSEGGLKSCVELYAP